MRSAIKSLTILILLGIVLIWFYENHIVVKDCSQQLLAEAWIDNNENGEREETETPLEGVTFHMDDIRNNFKDVAKGTTDFNGQVTLWVFLPGCPSTEFVVYPDPLAGYQLTTEPRMQVEEAIFPTGNLPMVRFGFTKTN